MIVTLPFGACIEMTTKEENLKKNMCFNSNHKNVTAGIFNTNPFYDKRDTVQVKYEMLRAASKDEGSITDIADTFGFSRKSYYLINKTFEEGGLCALLPQKKGPKRASKLNSEILAFIDSFLDDNQNAKAKDISEALETNKGIRIHPRTIYRHIKKN